MKPPRPVVADLHRPSACRAIPIQDVELPQGEVGILGPVIGHRADLPRALRSVDRADPPRGYTCRSRDPSSVAGHCKKSLDVAGCSLDQKREMINQLKDEDSIRFLCET